MPPTVCGRDCFAWVCEGWEPGQEVLTHPPSLTVLFLSFRSFLVPSFLLHSIPHFHLRLLVVPSFHLAPQVDLHHWITPLNLLDAVLTQLLREYPLVLVAPSSSAASYDDDDGSLTAKEDGTLHAQVCDGSTHLLSVPDDVWDVVRSILHFFVDLLHHATSKHLFGSVPQVLGLLAASRDNVARLALQVVQECATPVIPKSLPEQNHHAPSATVPGGRLVAVSVAHRSIGFACDNHHHHHTVSATAPVTPTPTDTSTTPTPWVRFAYRTDDDGSETASHLILTEEDFGINDDDNSNNDDQPTTLPASSGKKRRRGAGSAGRLPLRRSPHQQQTRLRKSTAEVFFLAKERAPRLVGTAAQFALLCHIRVAGWDLDDWTRTGAGAGVAMRTHHPRSCCGPTSLEWRWRAILALLHTAPADTMALFANAQSPEWFRPFTQLLREAVAGVNDANAPHRRHHDGIAGLAGSDGGGTGPPFAHKLLAVQCLTALLLRRDATRSASVLHDLGVGKSQTFGVLPVLLRYALASLSPPPPVAPAVDKDEQPDQPPKEDGEGPQDDAMDLGLAFYEGTLPDAPPREVQVARALELIEAVLTLAAAVAATPAGTSSLVDAGLIPSLVTAASSTTDLLRHFGCPPSPVLEAQLRFVAAQAVQLLDLAIVTHNQGLSGFLDLGGVDALTQRVVFEVETTKREEGHDGDDNVTPAQRMLLFRIVTCLSVVFQQENATLAAMTLRRPDLAAVVIRLFRQAHSYGGHVAMLLANLLSDSMNHDPHLVHYIHSSGIAQAFLDMIGSGSDVRLPAVPELIAGVPNVLAALSLTEDGAKAVAAQDPFPPLLQVFRDPRYAMPQSRCLLSEMTSLVGTGLDEICRHVERLKPMVLRAVAQALADVVAFAEELGRRERTVGGGSIAPDLESDRTCLIQYVLNFGQLLEHILHNEDHCDPFVEAGGFDALLQLFPASMSDGRQFLSHVSCLSSPTVSTLHHATVEDSLGLALKCLQFRYHPAKLIRKIALFTARQLDNFEDAQRQLFGNGELSLDALPTQPLHLVDDEASRRTALLLRNMAIVQWSTNLLAASIKSACQRSQDSGGGWGATDREWKQELTKDESLRFLDRLSRTHRTSLFEVCRMRAHPNFESSDRARLVTRSNLKYRLRIVCLEGAVVRDGVEIDSCANVGSMELGEVVEAFDRCINSSGILRYRTSRGWVSEMTRGHGREPIAEVIGITESFVDHNPTGKRIEIAVPGLQIVGLVVLSKAQAAVTELFGAVSKLLLLSIRTIPVRSTTFDAGTVGDHVARAVQFLSSNLCDAMNHPPVVKALGSSNTVVDSQITRDGATMYFGCLLNITNACLFDEKRERRLFNLPLLLSLVSLDPAAELTSVHNQHGSSLESPIGILGASLFILEESAVDFRNRGGVKNWNEASPMPQRQRVSRYVASSLPTVINLFRRILASPLSTSPVASVMSRVRWRDLPLLLGKRGMPIAFAGLQTDGFFEPERFGSGLLAAISFTLKKAWTSADFAKAPPHLTYPTLSLIGELMVALDDCSKKKPTSASTPRLRSDGFSLSDYFRRRQRQEEAEEEDEFEVDESAVSMLVEMGFDRERAIDAFQCTRSSRVDVAMEYVLNHAPPSPGTIQRRREDRERRQRRRSEAQPVSQDSVSQPASTNATGTSAEHLVLAGVDSGQVAQGSDPSQPMDIDDNLSGSADKGDEDTGISAAAKAELAAWMNDAPTVCCRMLSRIGDASPRIPLKSKSSDGNGEAEATTVVLCSFLLDLCHRYPDEHFRIVGIVLEELKEKIVATEFDASNLYNPVPEANEASVSALCHAVVLFTRALPKTRGLVLKYDLVAPLVASVYTALNLNQLSSSQSQGTEMPSWMAPALLLIDIMCQPVVGFSGDDLERLGLRDEKEGELVEVRNEQKKQAEELSESAKQIFAAVSALDLEQEARSQFDKIPAYFPLLPLQYVDACRKICLAILGAGKTTYDPAPGVTHATMMLLLRLLRSPKNSEMLRRLGIAEAILRLPKTSKFTGNNGLVSLIFRRLLEDEATLHYSMELEMRSTISKLQMKKSPPATGDRPPVSLRSFIEAVTPLLCRDPASFLKAMALSVRIFAKAGMRNDFLVSSLSQGDRAKSVALLTGIWGVPTVENGGRTVPRSPQSPFIQRSKGKSPHKSMPQKSHKRHSTGKITCSKDQKNVFEHGSNSIESTASSHITSLLMNAIAVSSASDASSIECNSFLWVGDLLEILCELVLAVPACACAVHNYRPHKIKDKASRAALNSHVQHALVGCSSPPKTFVNFAIHFLLPQDRWSLRLDHHLWDRRKEIGDDEAKTIRGKRDRAARITKVSHATARLILALVSRAGEGRKRVIADLAFALSGGSLCHGAVNLTSSKSGALGNADFTAESGLNEQNALLAWAELCLGIISPRSTGKAVDGSSALNAENIRLALENGMVHALLYAIHRVKLYHPMSTSTCGALLMPLECLTRSSVNDAVKQLVDRGLAKRPQEAHVQGSSVDVDVVDSALESRREEIDYEIMETEDHDMAMESQSADGQGSQSSLDDEESSDGSEGESSGEEEESQGMDDDEDDSQDDDDDDSQDDDDDNSQSSGSDEDIDEAAVWDVDYDDGFAPETAGEANDEFVYDAEEEDGTEPVEQANEDGWHRIESSAFGGMLLGNQGQGADRSRQGFIDAAEAMIGSLLQSRGDINSDTIRELENSLGIRIMGNTSRGIPGSALGDPFAVRMLGEPPAPPGADSGRRSEVLGTIPHIHQRNQPDVGHSTFSSGGRSADLSPMEFVFGGPSLTGGSRNYDLTNADAISDSASEVHLSQIDLQLFPGGPGSVALAGANTSIHPLLCGVDLPPITALVSDLLPHGIRATRPGQVTTRRPGDWASPNVAHRGYLVSTSTGNIIRTSRIQSGTPAGSSGLTARHVAGPIGWTDDGLPVDASVEEFSSAFERAVASVAQESATREAATQIAPETGDERLFIAEQQQDSAPNDAVMGDAEAQDPSEVAENVSNVQQESGNSGDDGVASSLAQGLRLSPGSDVGDHAVSMAADDGAETEAANAEFQPPVAASVLPGGAEEIDGAGDDADGNEPMDNDQVVEDQRGHSHQPVASATNGLVCPPDVDPEVFCSLPLDMQQDCVNQFRATQELAAQLDGSTLDPEFLAALPEDVRREVIDRDRRERQILADAEPRLDPSDAQDMDNANFLASLSPELRADILLTADDEFLQSLPPNIVAEAHLLRERAIQPRRHYEDGVVDRDDSGPGDNAASARRHASQSAGLRPSGSTRKKSKSGKFRVENNREELIYRPTGIPQAIAKCDLMMLVRMLYLMSPVRPPRLLHKLFYNLASVPEFRRSVSSALVYLLHDQGSLAKSALESLSTVYTVDDSWRRAMDEFFIPTEFPPPALIGATPSFSDSDCFGLGSSLSAARRKQGEDTMAAIAANLQTNPGTSSSTLPPVVCLRIVDILQQLCKGSARFCLHFLVEPVVSATASVSLPTCFELMLDLLDKPVFSASSSNLDHLLSVLESAVTPLSQLPKPGDDLSETTLAEHEASSGKEWVDVPRVAVSQARLQSLCSILRNENCRDTSFTKVNTIVRRLCRVEGNRGYVLGELASVADALGCDAVSDLRALKIRLEQAVCHHNLHVLSRNEVDGSGTPSARLSSSITLSTSSSELKLLRVLQTLQALCLENWQDSSSKKVEGSVIVTEELVHLLRQLDFSELWDELTSCLTIVQVLEGVKVLESTDADEENANGDEDAEGGEDNSKKKLRNSAAGLLTRFLPAIEAFFVANASATRPDDDSPEVLQGKAADIPLTNLVGGQRLISFVATNEVLLNALIRNNSSLLDKGFRALVQVSRCRVYLDFDVKQQWFKMQMRRLRQHASRRHGSLRLNIRRQYVFEDAYHQLRLRNVDEVRGRLHITFGDEQGVDAGGLSREFFDILAKEIFNPDYALFTSTEDGCTFQPNPNSSINPDHLSYFRFVGRVVGKAVSDGYLLDAHFTRSLYKHMLGAKLTYHDMEAIDPDYYRNLKMILEYNLADLGLDLNFSIEDHSFGGSRTFDLVPGGRSTPVTEDNKEEYVHLVCQHRMTTAIESQIKAYLDGFYELVPPDLVAVFTPRELELLISGLPDIDVQDLKQHTDYVGWKASDPEIQWFWSIMFSLSRNEKAAFLQFVTGSSKVPLAGFAELQGMRGVQKFSIHKVAGKAGSLMSAHTCFNSLDLPNYGSEEEMRTKLLLAINEGSGAFLFA